MSDYIPKDPLGPNDPRGSDRYGNTRFEPADDTGKGPYILLGLLVAIGLIGGLLYFNGTPKDGENVAQAPNRPAIERTVPNTGAGAATTTPAIPAKPMAPADTAPAPAAPADTGKQ
jgi:hypothetical protein